MEIFDIPFSWLIGISFGLTAIYVLLRGLSLPPDFEEKQKARSELKKKIAKIEQSLIESKSEKQSGENHNSL